MVENFGAIENRNSSDISFHFAATWQFGASGARSEPQASEDHRARVGMTDDL